jgi:calnexin
LEQFTDDWEKRWKPSHAKKDTKGSEEEWTYNGEWAVEEPIVYKGMEGDKGLVVKSAAAHHAISAKFPKKIDPKGKTLVVQYEVKLQSKFPTPVNPLKLAPDLSLTIVPRRPRVRWRLPQAPP